MSREILEECKQAIIKNLQKWQYKDEMSLYNVLQKIEAALADHKKEPVAAVNVWYDDGLSCFNTCWNTSPTNWPVGTYYLHMEPPRQEPVYLSSEFLENIFLFKLESEDWFDLAKSVEIAALKANGLIK